jgi:S1-C subfamily serine protease
MDMAVELIHATVQIEASYGDGTRNVGTGFLVETDDAYGASRVILVTAGHVLERMPGPVMTIGYRHAEDGAWKYHPQRVEIRQGETPLWVTASGQDIAVIEIVADPDIVKAAIPAEWLADEAAFESYGMGPGDEMMALGYPWGMSANGAGFAILRSGKVASYPVAPTRDYPTFLLDFSVFPGNSGGPVFVERQSAQGDQVLITGVMTQQLELNNQRLEIGVVTQASYVREALEMLQGGLPGAHLARAVDAIPANVARQPAIQAAAADQPPR